MLVVPGKVGRHEVLIARHPSARKPQAAGLQRRSSDRSDRARSSHLLQPPSSPPVEDGYKLGIEQHPYRQGRVVKIAPPRAGAGRRKRRLHKGSAEGELRGKGSSWQLTKSVLAKLKRLTSAWKAIFAAQLEICLDFLKIRTLTKRRRSPATNHVLSKWDSESVPPICVNALTNRP